MFRLDVIISEMFLHDSATDSTYDDEELDEEDYYFYDSEDDMKRQILASALEFVPEHGWTDLAIQKGAEAEGLSSAVEGLFPRGAGDLVLHFIEDCNAKLADQLLEESRINNDMPGAPEIPYVLHLFVFFCSVYSPFFLLIIKTVVIKSLILSNSSTGLICA